MTDAGYDDRIQFRAGAEKDAAALLDEIHLGGVNVSELARAGLVAMLRRTLDDRDELAVLARYWRGEVDEATARVLLGDRLDWLAAELAAVEAATD